MTIFKYNISTKKLLIIASFFILVIALPLIILSSQQQQIIRQRAQSPDNSISVKLNPSSETKTLGDSFNVDVILDNPSKLEITTAIIILTYDKSVLQGQNIVASDIPSYDNNLDNEQGRATLDVLESNFNNSHNATSIKIGTITFKSLKASSSTSISIESVEAYAKGILTALLYEANSGSYTIIAQAAPTATPSPTPPIPNLTLTFEPGACPSNSMKISWTSYPGTDKYYVYNKSTFPKVCETTQTSCINSQAERGKDNAYLVMARNQDGVALAASNGWIPVSSLSFPVCASSSISPKVGGVCSCKDRLQSCDNGVCRCGGSSCLGSQYCEYTQGGDSANGACVLAPTDGPTPTKTPTPTLAPDQPTNTPTRTSTPIRTPTPTRTPTPILAPGPGTPTVTPAPAPGVKLSITRFTLEGFEDWTPKPKESGNRPAVVYIYKSGDAPDPSTDLQGNRATNVLKTALEFSLLEGSFGQRGKFGLSDFNLGKLEVGTYTILVKPQGFLRQDLGAFTITPQTASVVIKEGEFTPVIGDINDDNTIDVKDYNALIPCFQRKSKSEKCKNVKGNPDINDDEEVNGIDYNLFLKSLSRKSLQGE